MKGKPCVRPSEKASTLASGKGVGRRRERKIAAGYSNPKSAVVSGRPTTRQTAAAAAAQELQNHQRNASLASTTPEPGTAGTPNVPSTAETPPPPSPSPSSPSISTFERHGRMCIRISQSPSPTHRTTIFTGAEGQCVTRINSLPLAPGAAIPAPVEAGNSDAGKKRPLTCFREGDTTYLRVQLGSDTSEEPKGRAPKVDS